MSFLSGSTAKTPRPKTKLLNIDDSTSTTNQEARPLPYFAGIQLLGLTWITPAMNLVTKKVKQSSGKDSTVVGAKYFADLAGAICHGVVDTLYKIYMDEEQVFGDAPITRGSEDFVEITTSRGICRLYWGTETQEVDPILSATPPDITSPKVKARTPQEHPPYRGQCIIVFEQLAFGQDTTNAPTVKVVVGRWPQPEAFALNPFIDLDINPAVPLYELITNPRFGLQLADAQLDLDALNDLAAFFDDAAFGISPVLDRQTDAPHILTQFAEYFFGFYRIVAGKLEVGIARPADDPDALAVLDEEALVKEPSIKQTGWLGTFNQTNVVWSDRNRRFKETSAQWIDRGNFAITGLVLQQTLDRKWITKQINARKLVTGTGQVAGLPTLSADLDALRSAAAGLKPGDLFKLVYDLFGLAIVCRILESTVEKAEAGSLSLSVIEDLSALATAYFTGDDDVYPPEYFSDPSLDALAVALIVELPRGLADDYKETLTSLVTRSNELATSYNIYRSNNGTSFNLLGAHDRFVIGCAVAEAYPADTLLVDDAHGMLLDLSGALEILTAQTEDDWLDNTLLLFAGDEIMSVRDVEWVSATRVRLKGMLRARYGSQRAIHGLGTQAVIVLREDLNKLKHSSFGPNRTRYFKLASVTSGGEADLSLLTPIEHDFADNPRTRQPYPPLNLTVNGSGHDARRAPGDGIDIAWSNTSWTRDAFWSRWGNPSDLDGMKPLVQVLTADGLSVELQETIDGGGETKSFSSGQITTKFGGADFLVRVYTKRSSFLNTDYQELLVTNEA